MRKNKVSILFMVVMLCMATSMAFGATAPQTGQLAYEAAEIGDNIIGGPVGYLISMGGIGFGAAMLMFTGAIKTGVTSLIGAGIFLASNIIATSMGILY